MARERDVDPGDVLGALVLIVPVGLWGAWVVLKLYEWHVMPMWEQAPHIGYGRAVGLLLFVALLKGQEGGGASDDKNDRILKLGARATVLALALLIGWLAA